jgi:rod shape-determining protein MreD
MRYLKQISLWCLILLSTAVVQALVGLPVLNISLVPVYWLGVRRGPVEGCAAGVFTGLVEDILAGRILGPSLLGKGLVGIVSSYISDTLFVWRPLLGMAFIFLMTLVDEAVVYLSLTLFVKKPVPFENFLLFALISAIVNTPAGAFIKTKNE